MPFQNDPYFSAREQTPAAFPHLLVYCYHNHLYFVPTLTGLGPLCYPHKTPFKNLCTLLCSLHTKPHTGTHSQTYRTVCTQLHTLTSYRNTLPHTRRIYKRETCLYVHTCRLALACLVVSVPKPAQCFSFQIFPLCHSVGPTGSWAHPLDGQGVPKHRLGARGALWKQSSPGGGEEILSWYPAHA